MKLSFLLQFFLDANIYQSCDLGRALGRSNVKVSQ